MPRSLQGVIYKKDIVCLRKSVPRIKLLYFNEIRKLPLANIASADMTVVIRYQTPNKGNVKNIVTYCHLQITCQAIYSKGFLVGLGCKLFILNLD